MTQYRRFYVPGGTYFFTVNLAERSRCLLVQHIDLLRGVMAEIRQEHPFRLEAMVVLPDHLHALWTLPSGDRDFSVRWRKIKARFSRGLPKIERRSASRVKKGERGIWQRRYWEHVIRDEDDWCHHIDYIHFNPVKHGYCEQVLDWPYSTFHAYVEYGVYPNDWAGALRELDPGRFGE